ncbi:MAG: B12-binding domain-containing radical SAM protein [Candidatus Omnitrophica bacterium]|nr:B12-binding domain-containing radical SAM protein [Candidatus Omnitrophota bacterium]MCM8799785.1 B12-binding domain-containing radical SAM protein [Candidatus Omnitrophota bacterium]
MKITFLIPPVLDKTQDVDRCFGCNYAVYFLPLLPVLYCATILKDRYTVNIIDFAAQRKKEADFIRFIDEDDSKIYVFYSVFLSQNTDLKARELIRERKKDIFFIFSGPQATYAPEVFLDKEDTFAVRGEPDFILKELIDSLLGKQDLENIAGISYRKDNLIVQNPSAPLIMDLDSIPIPDRRLLDHRFYFNPKLKKMPHTAMLTSRGCFGQCTFCVPNSLSYARELEYKKYYCRKPPPRLHSPERVIEEFKNIKGLGFRSISIIDDEFLWDEERTFKICKGIKDLKLEWSCLARPDMITENSARWMKESGCHYVDLGTESFNSEILKDIKKEMTPEDTKRAVYFLKKYKIEVEINIILGATDKETSSTIKETLKELKKLNVDYVLFSIANPFPGTEFYETAKQNRWLFYGDYVPVDSAKNSIISYPHLSKEDLERFIKYAYISYYLNPHFLLKKLFSIRDVKDFFNKFLTWIRFFYKNFLRR